MAGTSLAIVLATLYFLVQKSRPAFKSSGIVNFFTKSYYMQSIGKFGVLGILENTVLIAVIALVIGSPIALALAIFINEYAPARVKSWVTGAIDLLAAVPSIIFGLWGYYALEKSKVIINFSNFLTNHVNVIPLFRVGSSQTAGTALGDRPRIFHICRGSGRRYHDHSNRRLHIAGRDVPGTAGAV
jgi:phosphate transport system permease protein